MQDPHQSCSHPGCDTPQQHPPSLAACLENDSTFLNMWFDYESVLQVLISLNLKRQESSNPRLLGGVNLSIARQLIWPCNTVDFSISNQQYFCLQRDLTCHSILYPAMAMLAAVGAASHGGSLRYSWVT
jgi:hypothetical protein